MQEFCIKLSMASIEGRPLSVTLARFEEPDTPLIGCSPGFLALSGRTRQEVLGQNCRFLNQGCIQPLKLREKLRESVRSGMPFMGVLQNNRHVGRGKYEMFENLLHLVVVVAGTRAYMLGIQADVTGLNLDLSDGDGGDAIRLQKMFDAVLAARVDAWIHIQEGSLHALPLYLYIRHDDHDSQDQVEIVEGALCGGGPTLSAPDQYLVLAPRVHPQGLHGDPLRNELRWQTLLLGETTESGCSNMLPLAPVPAPVAPQYPRASPSTSSKYAPAPRAANASVNTTTNYPQHSAVANARPAAHYLPEPSLSPCYLNESGGAWTAQAVDCAWARNAVPAPVALGQASRDIGGFNNGNCGNMAVAFIDEWQTSSPLRENFGGGEQFHQSTSSIAQFGDADVIDNSQASTMKTQLRVLDYEDPISVLVARGITKLGLQSAEFLRAHFNQYGAVKDVHIPFVLKKRRGTAQHVLDAPRQQRVAGRGFVVMETAEDAKKLLAMGVVHLVHDVKVTLEPFCLKDDCPEERDQ